MFDKLVESKSHAKENKKRGGYLLMSSVLVVGLLFSAGLWNLFAEDLGLGAEELKLSMLVAPISNDTPPEPIQRVQKRELSQNTKSETITRQANIMRIDESQPAPDKISAVPNRQKPRPNGYFLIRDGVETEFQNLSASNNGRNDKSVGNGISNNQSQQTEIAEKTIPPPPPAVKKTIAEPSEKKKTIISEGVINGQATFLPKPPYPPTAKAIHAGGNVNVQVTIDETGRVVSAKALDGHILLKPAAEKAAWSAKFNPTFLSKQPVKVTGVIVYRFEL